MYLIYPVERVDKDRIQEALDNCSENLDVILVATIPEEATNLTLYRCKESWGNGSKTDEVREKTSFLRKKSTPLFPGGTAGVDRGSFSERSGSSEDERRIVLWRLKR